MASARKVDLPNKPRTLQEKQQKQESPVHRRSVPSTALTLRLRQHTNVPETKTNNASTNPQAPLPQQNPLHMNKNNA
jgi:hypothetical protein